MAHGLEVPLALAGHRIQRQHGVREQVVALAEAAVEVVGRRARGGEHPSALLVDGDAAPGVGAAVVFPFHPLPGVVTDLSFLGNGVENPLHRAGDRVVAADMAGRRVVALVDAGRDDQHVLEHRARRRHLDHCRRRIDAEVLPEIDEAIGAERGDESAGLRVHRVDAVAHEMENALATGPFPVDDAAVAQPDDVAVVVFRRVESPDLLARRGVQRHSLEARRRDVHHPVDHDRVRVHRRALIGVAGLIFPGAFETMHVGRMDLSQWRVLIALRITAVDGPVDIRCAAGRDYCRVLSGHERRAGSGENSNVTNQASCHDQHSAQNSPNRLTTSSERRTAPSAARSPGW